MGKLQSTDFSAAGDPIPINTIATGLSVGAFYVYFKKVPLLSDYGTVFLLFQALLLLLAGILGESCIIKVDTWKREWYNREKRKRKVSKNEAVHKGIQGSDLRTCVA